MGSKRCKSRESYGTKMAQTVHKTGCKVVIEQHDIRTEHKQGASLTRYTQALFGVLDSQPDVHTLSAAVVDPHVARDTAQ